MSTNPTHQAKVKHVEIDHHFVREKVLDGVLQVNFIPLENQVADVLTKPLTPKQFAPFRDALRVLSLCKVSSVQQSQENQENNRITN